MPELPEVETIRRDLERVVVGRRLLNVDVFEPRLLQNVSKTQLGQTLCGQTLSAMRRRGKLLIFDFDAHSAVVHLRMSGWFSQQPGTHTRMVLGFERVTIYFDDTRRFGTLHLVETGKLKHMPPLYRLGVEPLSVSANDFAMLCDTSREIKRMLLDQTKLAGLGNIYVCEALFQARIHPQQSATLITKPQRCALLEAIQHVLKRAIENHGSTLGSAVGDYRTLGGAQGGFQDHFRVYGRVNAPCFVCQTPIQRVVQAGRSTFFCPNCQSFTNPRPRAGR